MGRIDDMEMTKLDSNKTYKVTKKSLKPDGRAGMIDVGFEVVGNCSLFYNAFGTTTHLAVISNEVEGSLITSPIMDVIELPNGYEIETANSIYSLEEVV